MSDEQLEIPVDEQIPEAEPETQPEGEETDPVESEGADSEADATETEPAATTEADRPTFDDPKLQARYDAASKLAATGDPEDIAESNRLLDKISIELGLMEKPEAPPALVRPPEPEPELDNLTAHESRAVKADIGFRKSEFSVVTALQKTSVSIKNNNAECDRIYADWKETVEKEGEDSYGAKMLKANWNAVAKTVSQLEQYRTECEMNKHFLEDVVKPNIKQMPWLEPIKDLYLEALVKQLVDPTADPEIQKQQMIRAGVKFPAAKAKVSAPSAQSDSAKAAIERVRKLNSLAKPKGMGGVSPKAAAKVQAKAQVIGVEKLTASQIAEYRNNGGRLLKVG